MATFTTVRLLLGHSASNLLCSQETVGYSVWLVTHRVHFYIQELCVKHKKDRWESALNHGQEN